MENFLKELKEENVMTPDEVLDQASKDAHKEAFTATISIARQSEVAFS